MKIVANKSPDHDENVRAGVDGVEEQRQQQRREEEPWPDLAPLGLQLALSLWDALKSPTLLQDDGSLGRRFQLKKVQARRESYEQLTSLYLQMCEYKSF